MRQTLSALLLTALAAAGAPAVAAPASGHAASPAARPHTSWRMVRLHTDEQFRGLAPVDDSAAWVAGEKGGVYRTLDGGATWKRVSPPRSHHLSFRDVEAVSADEAVVLAIGQGRKSRIYRTTDGGASWDKVFVNRDPAAFYDCLAMWPGTGRGLAMGDPVKGRFTLLTTTDGGATWSPAPRRQQPKARAGEYGFAASGTCLVTAGTQDAWIATGGGAARVLHSGDGGRHWRGAATPIPADPDGGGVFSLAVTTGDRALAVGGNFTTPEVGARMSARSAGVGRPWRRGGALGGYRSGVAWVRPGIAVAVGPTGSDVTTDGGRHWRTFDRRGFDAVIAAPDGSVWASGPHGRVAHLMRG